MVGVNVRDENIRIFRSETELLQPVKQGTEALGAVEAGVYQQVFSAVHGPDDIAVEVFERIAGQGNLNAIYVFIYVVSHVFLRNTETD